MSTTVLLRNQADIDAFRVASPDGYILVSGDRGIGLTGQYADFARAHHSAESVAWTGLLLDVLATHIFRS
jgi:hypothetical protein